MRNHRELLFWKDAILIAKEVYAYCKLLPDSERFGLVSQIQRAAVSISANIAEGCSWSSQKDFRRFIEISLGSAFELESLLMVTNLVYPESQSQYLLLTHELLNLQKRMNRFYQSIRI